MSFLSFFRKPAAPSLAAILTAGAILSCESRTLNSELPNELKSVTYNTSQDTAAIQSMPGELLPVSVINHSFGETWQIESYEQSDYIQFSSGEKRSIEVTCTYLKPNPQRPEGALLSVKRQTIHFRNDSAFVVSGEDKIPVIEPLTRSLCDGIRQEIRQEIHTQEHNDANELYRQRSANPIKHA